MQSALLIVDFCYYWHPILYWAHHHFFAGNFGEVVNVELAMDRLVSECMLDC
jgi:hypothetical protein